MVNRLSVFLSPHLCILAKFPTAVSRKCKLQLEIFKKLSLPNFHHKTFIFALYFKIRGLILSVPERAL